MLALSHMKFRIYRTWDKRNIFKKKITWGKENDHFAEPEESVACKLDKQILAVISNLKMTALSLDKWATTA